MTEARTYSSADCHAALDHIASRVTDYTQLFATVDMSQHPRDMVEGVRLRADPEKPYFFGTLASGVKFCGDARDVPSLLHQLYPHCNSNLIRALVAEIGGRSGKILDVGANIGVVSASIALATGSRVEIHAFEPSPETARLAAATLALNGIGNVILTEAALGDLNGTIDFQAAPGNSAVASVTRHPFSFLNEWETISVKARTVDEIVRERQICNLLAVKIDVEGHELEVIRGSRLTIFTQRPAIVFEYTPIIAKDGLDKRLIRLIDSVTPYSFEAVIEPTFAGWGSPNQTVTFPLPESVKDAVNVFARAIC